MGKNKPRITANYYDLHSTPSLYGCFKCRYMIKAYGVCPHCRKALKCFGNSAKPPRKNASDKKWEQFERGAPYVSER